MIYLVLTASAFAGECAVGASGLGCPDAATLANVPEACEYRLVHDLDVPAFPNFSNGVPYSTNDESTAAIFDRVAYQVELDGDWVWASMDDPTGADPTLLGLPTRNVDPFILHTTVTGLNLTSNHPGIANGTGLAGNLEIWPYNYAPGGDQGLGASNAAYDFDDSPVISLDHGSFQLHDLSTNRTVFALNHFNRGQECETGLGDGPGPHTDWTGSLTCASHTSRRLRTYVRVAGEGCGAAEAATVGEVMPDLVTRMNAAYAGSSPVDAGSSKLRLQPDTIQEELEALSEALATTCTLDASVQTSAAGAYTRTGVTGADDTGAVVGTKDNPTRSFGGSSPELGDFGTDAGAFATFTSGRRLLAKTDTGGFLAGRWVRVRGTRGVFVGLGGTCDAGGDVPSALADWFDGDLSGW